MIEHDPVTGRFKHRHERFERIKRWLGFIVLAIIVVASALAGAAWMDHQLKPTMASLHGDVVNIAKRVDSLHRQVASYARESNARDAQVKSLQVLIQNQKIDLIGIQTRHDLASHDLDKGLSILQDEQDRDQLNNRSRTWEALRLLRSARKTLKPDQEASQHTVQTGD